jgi:hypothetical protein
MTAKSRLRPHHPKPDPAVPADQHGNAYCRCGVAIVDGDARHTLPDAPHDDAQRMAAGEREGD